MPSKRVTLPRREEGHIEFKERLLASVHLKGERRQQLVAQMRARLEEGRGIAVYVLGVKDDGELGCLTELELEEGLTVLRTIAAECGSSIERVERYETEAGLVAKVVVQRRSTVTEKHLVVAVAGHVNHGKSTLVACLITGLPDDGNKWLFMDTLPHEVERRLSADLHFAVLGFKDGKPVLMENPLDRNEKSRIVSSVEKLVSIVDTVGHMDFFRTTVRGIVGQEVDYGILVVAADDGVTQNGKEHLGVMLALNIPVIVCITKTDKVSPHRTAEVRESVAKLLKSVGRIPFHVRDRGDVEVVVDKIGLVVPIIETSAVTLQGYDRLYELLSLLQPRERRSDGPFLMYVDRIYNVEGVGTVVSGSVKQGRLAPGSNLLIGPDKKGKFTEVRVRSIETHYTRISEAAAGYVVGVALRGISHDAVARGMALCDPALNPRAVWSFEGEVVILTHPTRVATGYEPVLHCHTLSQSVKLTLLEKEFLKPGEQGRAIFEFKYSPALVFEGDRFVLREGRTKGIGKVLRILKYA